LSTWPSFVSERRRFGAATCRHASCCRPGMFLDVDNARQLCSQQELALVVSAGTEELKALTPRRLNTKITRGASETSSATWPTVRLARRGGSRSLAVSVLQAATLERSRRPTSSAKCSGDLRCRRPNSTKTTCSGAPPGLRVPQGQRAGSARRPALDRFPRVQRARRGRGALNDSKPRPPQLRASNARSSCPMPRGCAHTWPHETAVRRPGGTRAERGRRQSRCASRLTSCLRFRLDEVAPASTLPAWRIAWATHSS
jgi:hypothetical protein